MMEGSLGRFDFSSSLVEFSPSSSNRWGVGRDHSTIFMSHHGSRYSHGSRVDLFGMSRDHTNHGIDIASCMMEGILSRLDVSSSMMEFSLGSSNRRSVSRDHSTIFMSHHGSRHSHGSRIYLLGMSRDHTNHGIGVASSMMEDSLGGLNIPSSLVEVSLSSSNSRGVFGDHSTIRVSHHGSRHGHGSRINLLGMSREDTSHGIDIAFSMMESSLSGLNVTSSMVEVSLSTSNSRGVLGDHCTIRVSHHRTRHSHGSRINILGMSREDTSHGIDISSSMMESSLSGLNVTSSLVEVSLSSSNSRGVLGDHSTIRVSHHGSRHSHWSSINLFRMSRCHCNLGVDVSSNMSKVSLSSSNGRSISRNHSSIGVSDHVTN